MKPLNFVSSFDPYTARLEESRRKRIKWLLVFSALVILVLVFILGLALGLSAKSHRSNREHSTSVPAETSSQNQLGSKSLVAACNQTAFPQTCISSLSTFPESENADSRELVVLGMKAASSEVRNLVALVHKVSGELEAQTILVNLTIIDALGDCSDQLMEAAGYLADSVSEFNTLNVKEFRLFSVEDIHTWLSSALTYHTTCFDGLDQAGGYPRLALQAKGEYVQEVLTNALSFYVPFKSAFGELPGIPHRRLLSLLDMGDSPSKELLQSESSVTVARDGSGQFVSIQEAVEAAPLKSRTMHVIYIKQGVYEESVLVPKAVTNLALVGDGIDKTIIQGQRSVAGGSTAFNSATLAVNGKAFMASHLTITNAAGPKGNQAVALRVSADQAAFYRCSFRGYQGTVYAHSSRQFYRECIISGTVDFVFGNAAAVFQRCDIVAQLPDINQRITVAAQGRLTALQNTGFSFQGCTVDGVGGLVARTPEYPAYLGRPWKDYARTVFMESNIGRFIYPAGWIEFEGAPAARYRTVFCGEYLNVGQGAAQAGRVNWSTVLATAQANEFTVGKLITGLEWLPKSGIVFGNNL